MLFRKEKKCLLRKLFTIAVLLFVPFFIVLNTTSVFAVSKDYYSFKLRVRYLNGADYVLTDPLSYGHMVTNVNRLDGVRAEVTSVGSVPSDTNFISVTGKLNLVAMCDADYIWDTNLHDYICPSNNRPGELPYISAVSVNSTPVTFMSDTLNVYTTDWLRIDNDTGVSHHFRTFTYEYSFIVNGNIPSSISNLAFFLEYPGSLTVSSPSIDTTIYYFEGTSTNRMSIDYTVDKNTAILAQQTQLQQLTLEALNNMNQGSDTYYNNYYESVDNIEGQSTSDISNAESSQTTSIIATISSFVSALGTIQTGSCELTLPFPQFIGGNTTVNPCTGKDKAPTIVQVGSSMFLIGVFIPFAFMVLKMIYNEIRSFTNG